MTSPRLLLLAASAALIGCGTVRPQTPDPRSDFTLSTPSLTVRARLEGDQLFGQGVNVVHAPDGYRGWTGVRLVHLSARGDRLVGIVGDEPAELEVDPLPGGVRISGNFGGERGLLAITAEQVIGRIGTCVFEFHREAPGTPPAGPLVYVGQSLAWGRPPLRLVLPTGLERRPPQERAAFLSFFLLQGCGRIVTSASDRV